MLTFRVTDKAKCPYCNATLASRPKRGKRCPHCGETIRVSRGELITQEEARIREWVGRLGRFGVTRKDLLKARKRLSRRFGTQASLNDTAWGILNRLVTKIRPEEQSHVYEEMARLARIEGRDAKPFIAEARRAELRAYKRQGCKTVETRTCNDDLVCPSCKALEGKPLAIDKAVTSLPVPTQCTAEGGCRCWYVAADPWEALH